MLSVQNCTLYECYGSTKLREICTLDAKGGTNLLQSRVTRNRRRDITKGAGVRGISRQWSVASSQREEGGRERAVAQSSVAQTSQLPNEGKLWATSGLFGRTGHQAYLVPFTSSWRVFMRSRNVPLNSAKTLGSSAPCFCIVATRSCFHGSYVSSVRRPCEC
jgi:hypothetical protein